MGGKNSAGGITWVVNEDKLFEALKNEQDDMDRLLKKLRDEIPNDILTLIQEPLQEVDKMAYVWLKLYHSLVLLHAAMGPPSRNGLNAPEPENGSEPATPEKPCGGYSHCLDQSHKTPAWSEGDIGEEGWLGYVSSNDNFLGVAKDYFKKSKLENYIQQLNGVMSSALAQREEIEGDERPLLQHFLDKSRSRRRQQFDDFEPVKCLAVCFETVSKIRPGDNNENKADYIKEALYRIATLWHEDIQPEAIENLQDGEIGSTLAAWEERVKVRLDKMDNWWQTVGMSEEAFVDWMRNHHRLNEVITVDDEKAQWALAGMVAMLYVNVKTLTYIYDRCFGETASAPYTSLAETVSYLTSTLAETDEDKKTQYQLQWFNLRFATFEAVIWHVIQQMASTVKRVSENAGE